MEDKKYKLYSLNDETGVRYIGITTQKLSTRLSGHLVSYRQAFKHKKALHYRHCWIKSLIDKRQLPTIHLISYYDTVEELKQAEIKYIREYKAAGIKLVNLTLGGDGTNGFKHNPEEIAKISIKVDQYTKTGVLIKTHASYSEAARSLNKERSNGKLVQAAKGRYGRRTAFGYIWRIHGEPFDKHPVTSQWHVTEQHRKSLSKRQLENNVMKGRKGLLSSNGRPVIIVLNDIIVSITESVKEVPDITRLSLTCISNMLRKSKEVNSYKLFYANKDIVQSLQKCKSSTLQTFVGQKYKSLEVED